MKSPKQDIEMTTKQDMDMTAEQNMTQQNMPSAEAIRKNMLWNVVGSVGFIGAQWVMTILIVHLAGYTEAGYLSLGFPLPMCLPISLISVSVIFRCRTAGISIPWIPM